MARLEGKTALITGAAGGMGRAACRRFAAEGARVLATDVHAQVKAEIEALGEGIAYVPGDLSVAADRARVADAVRRRGRLDVLYNNHGVILGRSFAEVTEDDWDRVLGANLKSVFFLTQAVAPYLAEGGAVINVSSTGAYLASPGTSVYAASKAGLLALTRSLAVELADRGVRVNAIAPAATDTPMPHEATKHLSPEEKERRFAAGAQRIVLKRFARPEEIVNAAVFLASDEASFMTGSTLLLDGGLTAC